MSDISSQQWQFLFSQSPLGCIEWTKDWKIARWNLAASNIFGWKPEEAVGMHFMKIIPSSEHSHVTEVVSKISDLTGGKFSENNNLTKDGKIIRCRWINTPLVDENGEMIGAASLVQDISKEVESQKRLLSYYERLSEFSSKLLELSQKRIISGEKLGATIRELTQFAARALKVEKASCWLFNQGKTSATAITCYDSRTQVHTSGDMLLFDKFPIFFSALIEQKMVTADNARLDPRTREFNDSHLIPHHIFAKLAVTVRRRGQITGMICFEHGNPLRTWAPEEQLFASASADMLSLALEERERSIEEAKNRKLQNQLYQNQKLEALGALAGGIAHDFNNILSAVLGSVELAELRLKNNQSIKEQLKTITDAGNRAKELVQQILSFSRNAPAQIDSIPVNQSVQQAVSLLRASIPTLIELETDFSTTDELISSTITQIHQIIINLVTNASHAIGNKKGKITIRTATHQFTDVDGDNPPPHIHLDAGNFIEISVKDDGKGMTSEILNSIFDPFFTTKETGKGTGLGLSIVHSITRTLNGAVTVESTLDIGTIFRVFIPQAFNETKNASKNNDNSILANQIDGEGKKVLVVDDEESVLTLTSEFLKLLNFEAKVFNRPDLALEEFRLNSTIYALVITDLTMPMMTGFALAESIKRISLSTPVILMTGNTKPTNLYGHGVSSCLLKPFTANELAQAIAPILRKT